MGFVLLIGFAKGLLVAFAAVCAVPVTAQEVAAPVPVAEPQAGPLTMDELLLSSARTAPQIIEALARILSLIHI